MLKNWRVALFLLPVCVLAGVRAAEAGPIGYSTRAHAGGHLYAIDLDTLVATDLGDLTPSMGDDGDGMAFLGTTLYLTTGGTIVDELWKLDGPPYGPPAIKVGDTSPRAGIDAGLDSYGGGLYNIMASDPGQPNGSTLYTIDTLTGAATVVGSDSARRGDGLGINPNTGVGYTVDGSLQDKLYTVDLTTGLLTEVGGLGANFTFHTGLGFGSDGTLYMTTSDGRAYTINTSTGLASAIIGADGDNWIRDTSGFKINGFEGLAVGSEGLVVAAAVPEPATLALLGFGIAALAISRRRRTR